MSCVTSDKNALSSSAFAVCAAAASLSVCEARGFKAAFFVVAAVTASAVVADVQRHGGFC